ncbi:MAG: NAD-dependent succinate-semialdehyde dehydrogenase [Acidobacteriaceae bacterium]
MAIQSINPANGELLRSFAPLTGDALQSKIDLAAKTFLAYRQTPLEHRTLWMRKMAAILEHERDEFASLMTAEMGKPFKAAQQEVAKCAVACRYYAENAARMLADQPVATEAASSFIRPQPLGVVLAVMPWNFPFWQVFRFLAPALMAGNVGLLKHASNVPQTALEIEAIVRRAGFPRGVFQTLLIGSSQVEEVLGHPAIAAVTLTGSEDAGRAVAAQAGYLIKKSVLELGGSDPFIVMPSADIAAAAKTAVRARCINNGQSCIAAKRFIVADEIFDDFAQRFTDGMDRLIVGNPMSEDTDVGPLATAAIMDELHSQVQRSLQAGATLLTGGEKLMGKGNYYEPTVLVAPPATLVQPPSAQDRAATAVFREEMFGPVAVLYRAANIEHALALANDSSFGLGAAAWTRDPGEQQRFIQELEAGSVFINSMVASDPRLPFGGIKNSGYGRELSSVGMMEFMNLKTIVVA